MTLSSNPYKLYEKIYVRNDIQFVVNNTQTISLSEFVRDQIRDKDLSYRKVAAKSRGLITHSTVSEVVNGLNTNPALNILLGLAYGLGVLPEVIFAVARGINLDDRTLASIELQSAAQIFENLQTDDARQKAELMIGVLRREIERIRDEENLRLAGNDVSVNEKGQNVIQVKSKKITREGR